MIIEEKFVTPWSRLSSREFDSWHSMCSYLGAFPPSLANYFIRHFSSEKDIVLDPFSGRGTTLLEAKVLKRKAIASDLNPIALTLTEAKNQNVSTLEIYKRIEELESKYDYVLYQPEALAQKDEIHLIFHSRTVAQLIYLKRKLLKSDKPVDKYLLGIALGILHGGERSDGTSGYASIDMPNTFSMSPDYVRRFVQKNHLNRLHRNVFDLLREKTLKMFKNHKELGTEGIVLEADAKNLSMVEELSPYIGKVDLVLSSPPYLGIVNYAKQNWIRSWFLNHDPKLISEQLDDDLNLNEWLNFAKLFVTELKKLVKGDGVAIFVIGDVAKSRNSVIPLAREFCLMIREINLFENIWCFSDSIKGSDKTTRIWGDTRGSATATDRIVILSDSNPFTKFKNNNAPDKLNQDLINALTKDFIG